jgi:lipopolysaccharide export system permease protein
MFIIDRYLIRLFVKVLVVCFVSLSGLFIVIDGFGNLDEFLSYSQQQGSLLAVLAEYYGARVLSFFDRTSGLMAMIATLFAVTWLQRSNELTALMATGISKARLMKPLIGAVVVVSLLGVANRELLIPNFREKLTRNAQDWNGDKGKQLEPRYDNRTDILISGQSTYTADRRIERPNFQLPQVLSRFGRQLAAGNAFYQPPQADRPGGYLLDGVQQPGNLPELESAAINNLPVLLSPRDTPWLKPGQCFVVSDVTFEQLTAGRSWQQFSSTGELIAGLRNPSLDIGADVRVTIHSRIVRPLLDMTLVFLALPLVLTRENRNIFVVAGLCLLVVSGFFLVILACHALGANYLLSPALAAWCPLLLFAPLAFTMAQPFRE